MIQERYYRPELDVLRLIAFLCVFFTHRMDLAPIDPSTYFWSYHISFVGVFGVPVFFLLSAFLITELLLLEKERVGKLHIKAFYIRRILRIWPLYFAVFFGIVILARFLPGLEKVGLGTFVSFSCFAGNWYICKHGWLSTYPLNPLWSVSVEEQFYIFIPVLVALGGRKRLKIISIVLLCVAYVFIANYAQDPKNGFSGQWTNSFVQFQFFAVGTLLALYLRGRTPNWPIMIRITGVVASIGCWLIASMVFGIHADAPHLSTMMEALTGWLLVLTGTILLFLSLLGLPKKYLPASFIYLGRISYGLYMFHAFMLFLVFSLWKDKLVQVCNSLQLSYWVNNIGALLALIFTIILSMLSYRFFEKPFLLLKKKFTFMLNRD